MSRGSSRSGSSSARTLVERDRSMRADERRADRRRGPSLPARLLALPACGVTSLAARGLIALWLLGAVGPVQAAITDLGSYLSALGWSGTTEVTIAPPAALTT